MEFLAQSPTDDDIGFDRDDLVGISLLGDDPIFKKGISIENMYKCVVDEAGDIGSSISDELKSISDVESDTPDLLDMEPDEDELSYDGIDANEEIVAARDIFTGEADDDIDILDCVDSTPAIAVKEDYEDAIEETDTTPIVESVSDLEHLFAI
jgi:hypothetical protein